MMNKKSQATNIILFMVIIFFLAVSLVVAVYANGLISNVISTTALNQTNVSTDIINKLDIINTHTVDNTFAFIGAILIIGMMISAFLTDRHPAWFFIYIIVLAVAIFTAAPLANLFQTIIENPTFAASVASNMSAVNYYMNNYIKIIIVSSILSIIIALSKPNALSGSPADI